MKIEWRGVEELGKNFRRRGEKMPEAEKEGMLNAILYIHSQMPAYPPPPEGSRYKRTGKLQQSVTTLSGKGVGALSRVEMLSGDVVGVIGTSIVYSPAVIGEGTQKAVHKGRWWTLQEVVRNAGEEVVKILERYLRKAIE